jgi:aryl-alcohol dehydrogenase-like predicted oxidoreductase
MADKAPPPAPTRPLGTTGMNITRVGVGTWAIGGPNWAFGWGPQMRYRSPP